jgi:hypothetical protein
LRIRSIAHTYDMCIKSGVRAPTNLPARARWYANRRMRLVLAMKREVPMKQEMVSVPTDEEERTYGHV